MTGRERRKHARIKRHFVTEIFSAKAKYEAEGITENVSQGGALIKTRDWRAFQAGDKTVVTFFLPPSFTDTDKTIGLRGQAVIKRIDQEIEGIAIQFTKEFRQFKKIEKLELADKLKYQEISHYLSIISAIGLSDFVKANPNGFLVEKFRHAVDNNSTFQFNTATLGKEYTLKQIARDDQDTSALEARVIEVKKSKLDSAANTITVGRSAANDIVLFNTMVSKSHAYLYVHPSGTACYLVDCGSKNGTLLNGKVLKPYERHQLLDGDEVFFGPQTSMVYFSSRAFGDFLDRLEAIYST
jgi:hypothetical protein